MLVVPDSSLLGDGVNGRNLRGEESLAHLREKTEKDLAKLRWTDHEEITDPERTAGQRMHYSELILRIMRIAKCPLYLERSLNFPDCIGLYRWGWKDDGKGQMYQGREHVASMQMGVLPEFSHLKCDWQDLPEEPVYGWRQVLVTLIKKKVLTWQDVKDKFGDPNGSNATRWRMETQQFR